MDFSICDNMVGFPKRSDYCHRRTGYKEENHHLYGYSIARVQRTTIASSTIDDVNNYDVKRTTIGAVSITILWFIVAPGGVNNQPVACSGTGGVNS